MVLLAYVQVVREVNIKGWNYAHVLDIGQSHLCQMGDIAQ